MKPKHAFILALLLTLLVFLNSYFLINESNSERREIVISRVIDGDTFDAEDGTKIRLLNINTPEKNQNGYGQASDFLSDFENRTVEVEELSTDRYGRTLARVYFSGEYLNLKLVELGLAKKFLVHESELKLFNEAENEAVKNSLGLWKKSSLFDCFSSSANPEIEIIILENSCPEIKLSDLTLEDESRKQYKLEGIIINKMIIHSGVGENNSTDIFLQENQAVWNNDRDTIYIFDAQDKIVHHKSYGY